MRRLLGYAPAPPVASFRLRHLALLVACLLGAATGARGQNSWEGLFAETVEDRQRLANVPISAAEEGSFGRQLFDHYVDGLRQQGITVTRRGRDAVYLQRLTAELRGRMRNAARYPKVQVWVAESDLTDARSFPGGYILVYRGLLDFAESEAAIVGVLGHELSHLDHGHQLELPRRLKLAQQTVSSRNFRPDQWFQTGKLFASYLARPFRPEQETEADADAVAWMLDSGYDALELARFFARLQARDGAVPGNVPTFLRTHPPPGDREQAVHRQVGQADGQPRDQPPYRGHQNLRRRLPRSRHRFAE